MDKPWLEFDAGFNAKHLYCSILITSQTDLTHNTAHLGFAFLISLRMVSTQRESDRSLASLPALLVLRRAPDRWRYSESLCSWWSCPAPCSRQRIKHKVDSDAPS